MRNSFKFFLALIVLFSVFGCNFFKKKQNEQIEQYIKESQEIQRKNDSIFRKELNDSIMKNLHKQIETLDSHKTVLDSIKKELDKELGKKPKKNP